MPLDTVIGPSLNDLMNQKAMQQMQIYGAGQEAQLRNLQVQSGQEQLSQQNQLRDLFQNMQPGQDMSSLLPSLMKLGPQGIDAASKMSTSLVAMQQMQRMEEVRKRLAALQNGGAQASGMAQPGMQPAPPMAEMPQNGMQQAQAQNPNWVGNPMPELLRIPNPKERAIAIQQYKASLQSQAPQNPMMQNQAAQQNQGVMSRQQVAQIFREAGLIDEAMKLEPKVKDWKPVNVNGQVKYMPLFEDGTTGAPTDAPVAERLHITDSGDRAGIGINQYTGAVESQGIAKGVSPDTRANNAVALSGQRVSERGHEMTDARARDALAQGGKPPAGYRYKPDGNLEMIPGGPADGKQQQRLEGGGTVDSIVLGLRDLYNKLDEKGGITSTTSNPLSNLGAGIGSSGAGQFAGRMFGTENQSLRNGVAQTRPLLLQAIMKATGMSAKQMDSNTELKLYLSTATDPTLDVQTNKRALDMIEKLYGSGAKQAKTSTTGAKFLGFE